MNEPILQIARREITKSITASKFWMCLASIICILVITSPFGSGEVFNWLQRLFYWAPIALTTYLIGFFINITLSTYLERKTKNKNLARFASYIASGIAIGIWVYLINTQILGVKEASWPDFLFFTFLCIIISVGISASMFALYDTLLEAKQSSDGHTEMWAIEKSAFYKRLPKNIGRDIISLQAQDHYIEVTTTKGKELILLRLKDAMAELDGIDGQQIHRSWWVCKKHIVDNKREKGRLVIVLSNGNEVKVSRTFLVQTEHFLDRFYADD